MRNQLTVTITDVHGSRQFTLSHLIRRFLAMILLVLLLILLMGLALMWQFWQERAELEAQIEDLYHQKQQLESGFEQTLAKQSDLFEELSQDKLALENEVKAKEGKIDSLQNTFSDLENQIESSLHSQSKRLNDLSVADVELLQNRVPSGMPTNFKMISDGFGWRTHPVSKNRSFHEGLDFACDVGTPVQTTADGIVVSAGWDGGYGLKVVISHGFGFKTVYAHLSKSVVKRGDIVAKGDDIGLSGNSGISSGAHLHYEVLFLDNKLNPRPFADWSVRRAHSVFSLVKEVPWESLADLVVQERVLVLKQSLPQDVISLGK